MWYVYILKCADNTLYTGVTNDISRRLSCHNAKKASKYTRARTPVTLIYKEPHRTKSRALKREAEIKRWPRQQKLRLTKA
ncbi:MAG: GIY-YIG nuclease family protein [Candidatus Omnitrophota bacterium]|nr:GIY-YIG nuclease family protein [Candidatus Omnitrophota bacterium]